MSTKRTKQHRRERYMFPMLNERAIAECLSEINHPLSLQDLKEPKAEKLRGIYAFMVEFLMGITREELESTPPEIFNEIDFAELHTQGVPEAGFYLNLSKLMRAVGVANWSVEENLLKPTARSVIRDLSAIINFAKFREERLAGYCDLSEQFELLADTRDELLRQRDQHIDELNALKEQRAAEATEVQDLKTQCELKQQRIHELNATQRDNKETIAQLKIQREVVRSEIDVEVDDIVALEQQINMLEAQVVPPPEKMRENLAQLAAQVEREKEEIRLADQKLHESLRRLENLGRVEKEVAKNTALIADCMEERNKSKKFRSNIKATEKKIHNIEEKLRELDTNQQHNLRKVDLAREKIQRVKSRRQNEIMQARQALQAAREEQSSTERKVAGTQSEIEQNEGMRRNAEKKIRLMEKEHEREMADMAQRYERLRAHVDQYHEHLFRAMEQPMSA
mmetsp:Transcript_18957/g.48209  ORF Transcript_18957/g.48209 Transcript_18957/m.48209 type:complete len:453 (-) Transcript_18957:111-1469(-)|eukprot:CAMPEP_0177657148 /NCGR_PEP_ID=MMETSP0447-20121125/16012_1 /TAXON_ID=0 /ORGANISM="Stygamoeba regulata, Strain BSH-02190019" /LENGTH=452 /DNA_ID=CAMNT_0019161447 /DNA_START=80 /DNA_END=1438 /DNA_ORIENTATION=+